MKDDCLFWDEDSVPYCNVCPKCKAVVERWCVKRNGFLNCCPNCGVALVSQDKPKLQLDFNWQYKNYEIREFKSNTSGLQSFELVQWREGFPQRYCFTLAYFVRDKEGYYLKFVGERPFDYIDLSDLVEIWHGLSLAQVKLDWYFGVTEKD